MSPYDRLVGSMATATASHPNRFHPSGGATMPDRMTRLSKALSWFLRHGATSLGVEMRPDGYVRAEDMMTQKRFAGYTWDDVVQCVETNPKQRFAICEEDGKKLIRAQQGHSLPLVASEQLLTRITDSSECPVCVHGTFQSRLKYIQHEGLKTMSRNHIHLFPLSGIDVISGPRANCDAFIHVNVEKAMKDGILFYRSENNVILTSGKDGVLGPQYFRDIKRTR
eukprot:Selendium_serpulae@DN1816_c0_g1_i1.p1